MIKKSGSTPLKFHRSERLHVVSIAAGMIHSVALTHDGALFYWVSSDPDLRCQQVHHHVYLTNLRSIVVNIIMFILVCFLDAVVFTMWEKYG